ncbi:MAG: NADH:flavin oxidoreductase [Promethearchaeota archaeon]|jgi:2,4-dienoyl-CoA reductase-like NADH-dependent reductase (Old Yellow Enzyme family)
MLVDLLDSLEVKGLRLKNRLVMPPMATGLATSTGSVTVDLMEHYTQRSKSLGLLVVEHSYVSINGRLSEQQLGIYDDSLVFGLEKLSSSIHATGTPVVIQINHAGRRARKEVTGVQPVAPSPSADVRQLSINEIEAMVDDYGTAAERAMRGGFDGVEVHGAHGFLVNQFYSPLTNKRKDRYGGCLDNRLRFPLEVVKKVNEKVGGRLLLYRMGSDDLDPQGTTIEDSEIFALKLEELGVDIIDISGGLCGGSPADLQSTQGYFIPQAEKIKKVVDIPVIGVGGIKDPEYANKVINEERVDLVAIGRELLNDRSWASQAIKKLKPNS